MKCMQMTANRAKTIVRLVGMLYGVLASLYLLTWNVCVLVWKVSCGLGLAENTALLFSLLAFHAVVVTLIFFQRPGYRFSWGPFPTLPPSVMRSCRIALAISTAFFAVEAVIFLVLPWARGRAVGSEWPFELAWSSLFLVQTVYVGVFFCTGLQLASFLFHWPTYLGRRLSKSRKA
jgi:hypothetical protein